MPPKFAAAHEALRQVWDGDDIPALKSALNRVNAEAASAVLPGFRYSLATYVLHTDLWNQIWLARLLDKPRPTFLKDWRVPKAAEWPEIRDSMLENYKEAMRLAANPKFKHKTKSDATALSAFMNIAVHTSYHVGQFFMIKRAMRKK
ncbi:MAG: DinB family protein [Fimbriimonadales bacterium]